MQYSLQFSELNTAPENKDGDEELDEYVTKVMTAHTSAHTVAMTHRTIL